MCVVWDTTEQRTPLHSDEGLTFCILTSSLKLALHGKHLGPNESCQLGFFQMTTSAFGCVGHVPKFTHSRSPTHSPTQNKNTNRWDWGLRSGAWALLPPSRVEGGQWELRGGRVSLFCSRARARTHDIAHGVILPLHKHVDRGWPHGMVVR